MNPQQKWAHDLNTPYHKRKYLNGKQTYEKGLNFIGHERNVTKTKTQPYCYAPSG